MADAMSSEALAALTASIETIRVYSACLLTWLLWEYLVTFQQEYQRFWKAAWSPMKVIFLLLRYWTIATMLWVVVFYFSAGVSAEACQTLAVAPGAASLGVVLLCGCTFALRVHALWDRKIWVLVLFFVLLSAELAVSVWSLVNIAALEVPESIHACIANVPADKPNNVWIFWLCPVIIDSVVLILTIARSIVFYERSAKKLAPLVERMLKDGTLYYLLCLGVNVFDVIWFRSRGKQGDGPLHAPLSMCLSSIACSRLCLRLKGSGSNSNIEQSSGHTDASGSSGRRRHFIVPGVHSKDTPSYQLNSLRTEAANERAVSSEKTAQHEEKAFVHGAYAV